MGRFVICDHPNGDYYHADPILLRSIGACFFVFGRLLDVDFGRIVSKYRFNIQAVAYHYIPFAVLTMIQAMVIPIVSISKVDLRS